MFVVSSPPGRCRDETSTILATTASRRPRQRWCQFRSRHRRCCPAWARAALLDRPTILRGMARGPTTALRTIPYQPPLCSGVRHPSPHLRSLPMVPAVRGGTYAARSQPAVRRAVTGPAAAPPARRRPPSGRPPWHDGPRQAVQPSSRLVAAAVRPAGAVLGVSWHPLGQSPGWRRAGRCGRGPRPLHQARSTRFPTCQASTRPAAPRPRRAPPARPRCAAGPPQRPFPVRVGQCAEPFKAEDVSISQSCGLCRRLKGVENAKHNDRGFGMCLSSVRHCLHDKSIARCRSNSGGRANPSNPSSCRLDHRSSASILVAIME